MIFIGAIIMAIVGLFGILEEIVGFVGPVIINGIMAGILLSGLPTKFGNYIPTESIARFLFVLSAIATGLSMPQLL